MRLTFLSWLFLAALPFFSCSFGGGITAVIWTDQPEFAFYSEYFNAQQDQYKIKIQYHEFPAQKLTETDAHPDIVIGRRLNSTSTLNYFKPMDAYFNDEAIKQSDFYYKLLSIAKIDEKQYLLPVSFNAPLIIFDRKKSDLLSNLFTVNFSEMKELGIDHNASSRGVYSRMGFSPVWDNNFLFLISELMNVSFSEANPLKWNLEALDSANDFARQWIIDANRSIQAVEDFSFKYFYNPPPKLLLSGRILFYCLSSNDYFTLGDDLQDSLGFRWLCEEEIVPIDDQSVYLGLTKKGKALNAADAFIAWFFNADTQHNLLEMSRQHRILETSFGICGGFSAMPSVTEKIFPLYYPNLLGHMPPGDFFTPPNRLPADWHILKERIILPYLEENIRKQDDTEIYPLENRISDWMRVNR